jgi:tRNA(Leu) C34 or U34 (ribose-2'-O)-methylase TrmL
MREAGRSLNLATAAGIALYEALRRAAATTS